MIGDADLHSDGRASSNSSFVKSHLWKNDRERECVCVCVCDGRRGRALIARHAYQRSHHVMSCHVTDRRGSVSWQDVDVPLSRCHRRSVTQGWGTEGWAEGGSNGSHFSPDWYLFPCTHDGWNAIQFAHRQYFYILTVSHCNGSPSTHGLSTIGIILALNLLPQNPGQVPHSLGCTCNVALTEPRNTLF